MGEGTNVLILDLLFRGVQTMNIKNHHLESFCHATTSKSQQKIVNGRKR